MAVCPHELTSGDLEEWMSFRQADGTCRCCGEVMDVEMNLRAQVARLKEVLGAVEREVASAPPSPRIRRIESILHRSDTKIEKKRCHKGV